LDVARLRARLNGRTVDAGGFGWGMRRGLAG
jgi:hypothetical protein